MGKYLHGGDIYSQETELDYSSNISPLGLPAGVRQAIFQSADSLSLYPDSQCRRLRKALAEYHTVPISRIICGNGAADLIFQLVWAKKPKKALLLAPSFQEYEQALLAGGTEITYFYLEEKDGFSLDERAWANHLEEGTDIAFFCNPHNLTGLVLPAEKVRYMAKVCRDRGVLFVIDECFMDFLEEEESYSFLNEGKNFENVFILKAFTKIYAMAGLRLGYGICRDEGLLSAMEEVRQPWSVSVPAQEAGVAALKEKEYVCTVKRLVAEERQFLKKGLERLSFQVFDSQANYLFFYVPGDGEGKNSLFEKMKERKILIRSCADYRGLRQGYYRICVKDRVSNEKLLAALEGTR